MDGWQDNMLASGQEGANAGPAAVPANATGLASITSDASCTNVATACLLWIARSIKASTHNAFKLGTALQKLALTYLLQYAEYARKYARKYAEYDK